MTVLIKPTNFSTLTGDFLREQYEQATQVKMNKRGRLREGRTVQGADSSGFGLP